MKIAIQGHPTRGKEVIQILESLGGKNREELTGRRLSQYYFINCNGYIDLNLKINLLNHKFYALEEFEKEFPFKIGDEVITTDGTIGIIDTFEPTEDHPYCIKANVGGFYWCVTSILKPYKKMERNVTLTLEKAKEWYNKGGELREIALQAYSEKELIKVESPKTWEEFCKNYPVKPGETFVDGYSKLVVNNLGTRNPTYDKNICPSQKSAKAHLAMIQLEQLRDCWLDGWTPIWDISEKWCIRLWGNELCVGITTNISRFLTFPTKEMAEEFLECFRDLIELAKYFI